MRARREFMELVLNESEVTEWRDLVDGALGNRAR